MIGRRRYPRFGFVGIISATVIGIYLIYVIDRRWLADANRHCSSLEQKLISLCSARSTKRGMNQKIIAISLFGPTENPKLFSLNNSLILLRELINEMEQVYPKGWILRVYYDEKILSRKIISDFEFQSNSIDFCDLNKLNLSFIPPKIWRFLPAIDETVAIMASRDLDSPLTPRERAAMDEWLSSNFSFHFMRDHQYHAAPIMGGMWAFRVRDDRSFSKVLRSKIFNASLITQYALNRDQQFLAEHLWPYANDYAMIHASYWCNSPQWNKHHRPFPTQRPLDNSTSYCFIGCVKPCCIERPYKATPCPIQCRPKEHQDWLYC